jgi:uncharacterized protein
METGWQFTHPFVQATLGGILIGLASWLLLAALGRVAGISGIAAGALSPSKGVTADETAWRWAFLVGLVGIGALVTAYMHVPVIASRPYTLLVIAGLLVGYGTVLGSGCTSGHGVCGLGRRSVRSLVATLVFMGAGIVTVTATVLIANLATNTTAGG